MTSERFEVQERAAIKVARAFFVESAIEAGSG